MRAEPGRLQGSSQLLSYNQKEFEGGREAYMTPPVRAIVIATEQTRRQFLSISTPQDLVE